MRWHRTSTTDELPADPTGEAMAATLSEMVVATTVELRYGPEGVDLGAAHPGPTGATATGPGPAGWRIAATVRLDERVGQLLAPGPTRLEETLHALAPAGLAAADRLRPAWASSEARPLPAPLRQALRDGIAAQVLARFLAARTGRAVADGLLDDTIDYLIELSGSRVEASDVTHGVVITDVLRDAPRLRFAYPADVRAAKRAPLLFDGARSVLVVDTEGHARTEVQRHRLERLARLGRPAAPVAGEDVPDSTATLVAEATRRVGGLGFLLRVDRSIWAFIDGQPLLVRRGGHWTTFPLQLAASIANMIGGGAAAAIAARAAFMVSAERRGAILAIVADDSGLEATVPAKDRYDRRSDLDPLAMRVETRLHHLIDAEELDEHTLARLAALDGATIIDTAGRLLAYGAIVASSDSQHEGARTAAAKTLSERAEVVLKVSVDGDITIFRRGEVVTTLLGRPFDVDA